MEFFTVKIFRMNIHVNFTLKGNIITIENGNFSCLHSCDDICIPAEKYCNSLTDCADSTDEKECSIILNNRSRDYLSQKFNPM